MPHPSQISPFDPRLQQIAHYWSDCLRLIGPHSSAALSAKLYTCYRHLGHQAAPRRIAVGSPLGGTLVASWLHDYLHPEASEVTDMIFDLNKLLLSETADWVETQLTDAARGAIDQAITQPFSEGSGSHLATFIQRAIWRDAMHASLGQAAPEWNTVARQASDALGQVMPGMAELDLHQTPVDPEAVVEAAMQAGLGNMGAHELAQLEAAEAVLGASAHFWTILPLRQIARVCTMYWLFDDVALAAQLPRKVSLDAQGQPHCEDGPAVAFADGWKLWAWHGVRVPRLAIVAPELLTLRDVAREPDPDARRVMLQRMGHTDDQGMMADLRLIDETRHGRLYQRDTTEIDWKREAGAFSLFLQQTDSIDPAQRNYLAPVPSSCKGVDDALLWSTSCI
ncbi:MAG: hypothetical protein E1N59_2614 [Puniceicoccaceae bacterium 5H]|nr:MAG: hypothetical protein E1N59_2614 [Puniceicoccaceae bacterium 5H]